MFLKILPRHKRKKMINFYIFLNSVTDILTSKAPLCPDCYNHEHASYSKAIPLDYWDKIPTYMLVLLLKIFVCVTVCICVQCEC